MVRERTHIIDGKETVANLQSCCAAAKLINKIIIDPLLHKKPRRSDHTCPAFRDLPITAALAALIGFDIITNDHRSMTAELHDNWLHVAPCEFSKAFADWN